MKVDISKLNDVLQISAVAFGALAALAALGAYFTSGRVQEALEAKVAFLESEQTGRVLTQDQATALVAALASIPKPAKPIHLIGIQGDREAIALASTIKTSLQSAGFGVDGVWEDTILGGAGPGILVRQKMAADPVGVGIVKSLTAAGLMVRLVEKDAGQVEVIVSYKP